MRWVTGWAINTTDEEAIALLPENVWTAALRQDGEIHEIKGPDGEWISYQVAEPTEVRDLTGWATGMRLIVRRVKPSRRDAKKLTARRSSGGWEEGRARLESLHEIESPPNPGRFTVCQTELGSRRSDGTPLLYVAIPMPIDQSAGATVMRLKKTSSRRRCSFSCNSSTTALK